MFHFALARYLHPWSPIWFMPSLSKFYWYWVSWGSSTTLLRYICILNLWFCYLLHVIKITEVEFAQIIPLHFLQIKAALVFNLILICMFEMFTEANSHLMFIVCGFFLFFDCSDDLRKVISSNAAVSLLN